MDIIGKIIITILLIMLVTAIVGLIGDITEKRKLCRIAVMACIIEVFSIIIGTAIFIWI